MAPRRQRGWLQVQGPQHEEQWGWNVTGEEKGYSLDIINETKDTTVLASTEKKEGESVTYSIAFVSMPL